MKVISLTKVMLVIFVMIGIVNFATLLRYDSYDTKILDTSQKQAVYKQLGIDLIGASDLLSEQARYYVLNGNKVHYNAYMNEANNIKTREKVIEQLKQLAVPQKEIDIVIEAVRLSNTLEQLEMKAFEAISNNKLTEAHQLMFSEDYAEGKQAIINAMKQYQAEVNWRIKNESKEINKATKHMFTVRIILNSIMISSIILCLFIIMKYIHKDQELRMESEKQQSMLEAELRDAAITAYEASSRLSAVYSSIPDTLFCKDINGKYTSCNQSFEVQAGMPESEIIGKTYSEVFKERVSETVDLYKDIDKKIISQCVTEIIEETVTFPNGSQKILETLKAPLIKNGEVVGLLGIGRDVTHDREVKIQLERIINTVQVAFMLSIKGNIVEANKYIKNHLGINVGEPDISIFAEPEQRESLIEMADTNDTAISVAKFNMKDGTIHRFLVNVSSLKYGNKIAYIFWGIDIEQDEVKNDHLRAMQQSLQTVLDAFPIPIRIVDLETNNIVYVNDSFRELLEYSSSDEIYKLKLSDILPKNTNDGTPSSKLIEMTVKTEKLVSFEVDYKTKSDKIIEALLSTRHIEYKGRPSSIGIIKDLTAEKKHTQMLLNTAAKEREANQSKSLFLANMSHEMRTPMNGIIGFSELALDDNVSIQGKNDYLNKIKSSGEGLLQIINNVLDISKIEAGRIELENIPFNIHEIFKVCQEMIMPKALEKGITLYCYAEPSISKKLLGDPTKLRQVLLNLMSNAVKFTHVGTVKLLSSIVSYTDDSITLHFEVQDSGIGISPEQADKIFEPFMQADATTTRKYGGTGLGLSITKNIIEQMGGELTLKSELEIGSKFDFELTFKTIPMEEGSEEENIMINEYEKPTFKGEILLVEDNATNQQVVCDHLARVGLETVIAVNGKIGYDIVRDRIEREIKPFDLIFMDIHMPVMDGLEAAKKLTEIGNQTPIVALTANVMSTSREIYRSHGMPDYLAKPFRTKELWACLLKYLTPIDYKIIDQKEESDIEIAQLKKVQTIFVKDNQDTLKRITDAVAAKDIKLAHRLTHTLKGVAGLIGGTKLQEAARAIEYSLSNGKDESSPEQWKTLEHELNAMLNKLSPLLKENTKPPMVNFNKEAASILFDKLESLLITNNTECMDLVDNLKEVPGTENLIEQIESFEFAQAYEMLTKIRQNLRGDYDK